MSLYPASNFKKIYFFYLSFFNRDRRYNQNMKILFIDDKSVQNSIRIGLLENMAHHDVHLYDDLNEALEFFSKEHPEMILIDFSHEFALEAMNRILKVKPQQHIITISDVLDCSEHMGCDFCLENNRKKRILKSAGIHELIYLIDNFQYVHCPYAHKFDEYITKDVKEK